jgi:hypothetical protein
MTKDEALKLALSTLDEVRQETFRLSRDGQTLYAEKKVWSTIISIKEVLAQPEQEPVAIHQFRSPHCADWYDGIPDHHDGHGPYEVRTLYTHPVKDLEDIDINITWNENSMRDFGKDELNFARAILGKAQEK